MGHVAAVGGNCGSADASQVADRIAYILAPPSVPLDTAMFGRGTTTSLI